MLSELLNRDIVKILTFFSISPGSKFSRNEIKEKTRLNNSPLDAALTILLKNHILLRERRLLGLNLEDETAKEIFKLIKKEYVRLKGIPLKIYYILVDVSCLLSKNKNIVKAYLFGSYAKLIYTDKSDIDLAIVLKKGDSLIVQDIKKQLSKESELIEPHFFIDKDMKQNDPLIKEILRNGVSLF